MSNKLSCLSLLCINKHDSINYQLKILDPENNDVKFVNSDHFNEIDTIDNFISSTKSDVNDKAKKEYFYWLEKGWYKSLDYYVASRSLNYNKNNLNTDRQQNAIVGSESKISYSIESKRTEKIFGPLETLLKRRTKRIFQSKSLPVEMFNAGLLNIKEEKDKLGLSGLKIYFIIFNVEQVEPGVYFFDEIHKLKQCRSGLFSDEMSRNLQGLQTPKTATFSIIIVADFNTLFKAMPYPGGLRDTYIETGRLGQKMIVSYGQYGLFCLPTPALCDRNVSDLLCLEEPDFAPLYSLTFGFPKIK